MNRRFQEVMTIIDAKKHKKNVRVQKMKSTLLIEVILCMTSNNSNKRQDSTLLKPMKKKMPRNLKLMIKTTIVLNCLKSSLKIKQWNSQVQLQPRSFSQLCLLLKATSAEKKIRELHRNQLMNTYHNRFHSTLRNPSSKITLNWNKMKSRSYRKKKRNIHQRFLRKFHLATNNLLILLFLRKTMNNNFLVQQKNVRCLTYLWKVLSPLTRRKLQNTKILTRKPMKEVLQKSCIQSF